MERVPHYKPPEHISEDQAELFITTARGLLPQREPSIISFDNQADGELFFSALSMHNVNGLLVSISEYESSEPDHDAIEVMTEQLVGATHKEVRKYTYYPATGYSRYKYAMEALIRDPQRASKTNVEFSVEARFIIQSVRMGLTDFTEERLNEVLTILGSCNDNNRLA